MLALFLLMTGVLRAQPLLASRDSDWESTGDGGRVAKARDIAVEIDRQGLTDREEAAARWAPVVWLHPEELYFPGDVHTFLAHVTSSDGLLTWERDAHSGRQYRLLPSGPDSEHMHLEAPIDTKCDNCVQPSFLYGQRPVDGVGPPVYVHIYSCPRHTHARNRTERDQLQTQADFDHEALNNTAASGEKDEDGLRGDTFTVTYWFFYPYNRGKRVCTSNMPQLGRILFPLFGGRCLAQEVVMGDHVGDWEHLSINFQNGSPKKLYLSIHNFGAFYSYATESGRFEFKGKDARKGLHTVSQFPRHLDLEHGRLVVYSANGSHGTWPIQGVHLYHPVVPVTDETGRGARWDTGRNMEVVHTLPDQHSDVLSRQWLQYRGRWGNPRKSCHAWLLGNCELGDGPTGINRKRNNFPCSAASSFRTSFLITAQILTSVLVTQLKY